MQLKVAMILVLSLPFALAPAGATTILQDGFEGYTAAPSWYAVVDANPGTPSIGEPWAVSETAVNKVNVNNAAAGTHYNSPGPVSGSNYLYLWDAFATAWAPLSAANQAEVAMAKNLTLDMMIYKNSVDGWSDSISIVGFDNAVGSYSHYAFDILLLDNGSVQYDDGTPHTVPGMTYTTDAWQHLAITAHFDTHTYDLTIGTQTAAGLGFGSNDISTLQNIAIYSNGANGKVAIDDISLSLTTVPEPSGLVLACGGLIGLLAYAWRKRR